MIHTRKTNHREHRAHRERTKKNQGNFLSSLFSFLHSPSVLSVLSVVSFLVFAPVTSAADYARGLAASIQHDASTTRLRAKPNQSPTSPLLVRVSPATDKSQRIEFIGMVAGDYDLRDYLERDDGTPAALAPMPIRIVSQLPPDHGTDVLGEGQTGFSLRAHYRTILIAACAAWALVPGVVLVRRAMNKAKPAIAPPAITPPTIADELRAMLDAAGAAPLSTAERGRLELLLIHFWRERLERDNAAAPSSANSTSLDDHAREIAMLRDHPRTRATVLGLERWLHRRDGAPDADAAALLAEFRRAELAPAPALVAVTQGGPQ